MDAPPRIVKPNEPLLPLLDFAVLQKTSHKTSERIGKGDGKSNPLSLTYPSRMVLIGAHPA